jgi:hypothetical protein
VFTVLAMPLAADAHHSEADFNVESVVVLRGTVTAFSWRNPHVYITMASVSEVGAGLSWEVETGATPLLARSGWTRDSLVPGDEITVRAHPARQPGRRYALLLSLEKADGTVLEQTLGESRPPAVAASLSGVWKGNLATLEYLAEGFDTMPVTAAGAAAQAAYDPNTENPAAMCVQYPSPAILLATTFFLTEIELGADTATLRNEWFDVERTVYMDGRGHPEDGARTDVQGHSIGWWEGGTLVVDTTHFADHRSPYQTGVPSGAQKHVVEQYTLSDDRTRLTVDVMLEDPEYLAEPFRGSIEWNYRPDLDLLSFDCEPSVSSQFVPR